MVTPNPISFIRYTAQFNNEYGKDLKRQLVEIVYPTDNTEERARPRRCLQRQPGLSRPYVREGTRSLLLGTRLNHLTLSSLLVQEDIVASERRRISERLVPHFNNKVWEDRNEPPANWNCPLPDYLRKRTKVSTGFHCQTT